MLSNIKNYLAKALSIFLSKFFNIFPMLIKARTLDRIYLTKNLDYKNRIELKVDSYMSYYRSNSCQKEPDTMSWLDNDIKIGDIFMDIGANVGAYSFVAASIMDRGTVICVEPSFSTYKTLCENIILNKPSLPNVSFIPFCAALCDQNSYQTFNYSDIASGAASHNASKYINSLNTPSIKLDDFIALFNLPSPTIVKIDVDGPEFEVLKGGARVISSGSIRSILVEVSIQSQSAVDSFMASFGYHKSGYTTKGETANIIYHK